MISSNEAHSISEASARRSNISDGVSHALGGAAESLSKIIHPLSKFFVIVAALLTFIMALLIVVDVFLRVFFNSPIAGTLELEQFMLATVVFFTLGYGMIQKSHVSIDILSSKYSPRLRLFLESVFSIIGACLFIIISWQNVIRAFVAIEDEEIGVVTGIPLYPFLFITALGSALIALVLIINLLNFIAELIKTETKSWMWVFLIGIVGALVMFSPPLLYTLSIKMPVSTAGVFAFLLLLFGMLLGIPIAFALGVTGYLGLWYSNGIETSLKVVRMSVFDSVADYFFCVIPFFVLMGFICFRSGLSNTLYQVGHKLFGQLPGGLSIGTIFGCAGFAAICGDSLATAGTMGSVAIPEMKKFRYQDALATSCVAAGGTLGILIPPSVGFVIYGLIAEQSIGKLFMAGIIPGVLLALAFSVIIYLRCKMNRSLGPPGPKIPLSEKVSAMKNIWPMLILFLIVIGGIYSGIFTPTEAGGVGVIAALVIGSLTRGLSRQGLYSACLEAMALTSMIFGILIGVKILGYFIVITEIPLKLADFIVTMQVSRYVIFIFVLLLYVVLGMVMNIIPMIMLTLPILFPTILALGFDPIWYGVIMVMMMEMGQITPPVGINVFVIAGVAKDVPMATIFKGILPFVLAMVIVIVILTIFPDLALILPESMDTLPAIGE